MTFYLKTRFFLIEKIDFVCTDGQGRSKQNKKNIRNVWHKNYLYEHHKMKQKLDSLGNKKRLWVTD